jgi:hypothetical protein
MVDIEGLLSQQGRLEQPWGVQWVKWIDWNKLSPLLRWTGGEEATKMGEPEEVYIVLFNAERAVVHAIQNRKSWEPLVAWESMAKNRKVGKD